MTRQDSIRGDLRVQRTRDLIVEALIELTIEKGFAAVTVQDIVRRARINRATFYRHYRDKFDLLDQYVQAVYALPDNHSGASQPAQNETSPEKAALGLVKIFEHVRLHSKFFQVMLGENGDPAFTAKIRRFIRQRIRRLLPEAVLSDENSADLYLTYISSGAVGVMSWWLEHEMPYSSEQLAAIMFRITAAILPTHALP